MVESKKSSLIIKQNYEERKTLQEKSEEQKWDITRKYRDQIHEIEKLENKEIEKLYASRDAKREIMQGIIDEEHIKVSKLSKIVYLLEQFEKKDPFTPNKVKGRKQYNTTGLCEILNSFEDGVLNVKLYLSECDKPKNKYVLNLLGFCKIGSNEWNSSTLRLPYDYGCALDDWYCGANVRTPIKYFPTIESAKAYANKRSIETLLGEFWGKYVKAKAEFIEINEQYNIEDFEEYRLESFGHYITNSVSHGFPDLMEKMGWEINTWDDLTLEDKRKAKKAYEVDPS